MALSNSARFRVTCGRKSQEVACFRAPVLFSGRGETANRSEPGYSPHCTVGGIILVPTRCEFRNGQDLACLLRILIVVCSSSSTILLQLMVVFFAVFFVISFFAFLFFSFFFFFSFVLSCFYVLLFIFFFIFCNCLSLLLRRIMHLLILLRILSHSLFLASPLSPRRLSPTTGLCISIRPRDLGPEPLLKF